ncbi:MAG: IMP cyclohydrolase [Lachnospiraceae bacterium]|jgi:IMP cyclohydrolase|nr:IMP cyclohydrolase [Lachnospiraceae bacterium]
MSLLSAKDLLCNNSYPGRGIITGLSMDGRSAVAAYFIMGRSENSRNRVFEKTEDGIKTKAFEPSKLTDPSLIIYSPVRTLGAYTIVTNGNQTDTIYDGLKNGLTFEQSLRTRTFEPDEPNYTPRISALLDNTGENFSMQLSIIKSCEGNPGCVNRYVFSYDKPLKGEGRFIHTYISDGNPLVSFSGEPEKIELNGTIDEFTDEIWSSLNNENKISLYVLYMDIETGKKKVRIVNKN